MATSAWTEWDQDVLPEVPGADAPFVRHHVKLAAIEFCERAWVWVVDQGTFPVAAGANEYDWEPPANTEVARILHAWIGKAPLHPKTGGELSALYGDYMQAEGPPQFFIQDVPEKFILVPKPTASSADGVTAKIAVKPTRAATGLDTVIFNRWHRIITAGALASLLGMGRKPWTDIPRSQLMADRFEQGIAKAKLEVIRSFAGARMRVRPNFF
jgi:hypothetical protein